MRSSTEADGEFQLPNPLPEAIQHALEALGKLRYGVIQLTVHDGKLMQLDITERRRFGN